MINYSIQSQKYNSNANSICSIMVDVQSGINNLFAYDLNDEKVFLNRELSSSLNNLNSDIEKIKNDLKSNSSNLSSKAYELDEIQRNQEQNNEDQL